MTGLSSVGCSSRGPSERVQDRFPRNSVKYCGLDRRASYEVTVASNAQSGKILHRSVLNQNENGKQDFACINRFPAELLDSESRVDSAPADEHRDAQALDATATSVRPTDPSTIKYLTQNRCMNDGRRQHASGIFLSLTNCVSLKSSLFLMSTPVALLTPFLSIPMGPLISLLAHASRRRAPASRAQRKPSPLWENS